MIWDFIDCILWSVPTSSTRYQLGGASISKVCGSLLRGALGPVSGYVFSFVKLMFRLVAVLYRLRSSFILLAIIRYETGGSLVDDSPRFDTGSSALLIWESGCRRPSLIDPNDNPLLAVMNVKMEHWAPCVHFRRLNMRAFASPLSLMFQCTFSWWILTLNG